MIVKQTSSPSLDNFIIININFSLSTSVSYCKPKVGFLPMQSNAVEFIQEMHSTLIIPLPLS